MILEGETINWKNIYDLQGENKRKLLLCKEQVPGLENQQSMRKLLIENKKIIEIINVMLTFSTQ